jgi:DNA-binding transcriptional LysR family regulator
MELRQLEHFVAVVEELHFTRAARRVHVVQSSLSSSIRALERELGGDLFVRSSRQVALTDAGRALLPAARRALAAAADGQDAVASVRGMVRGQLNVGAIQTFGMIDLPALLGRYHRRHSAVTIRLRHAAAAELARAVATGHLDIAFVDCAVDEFALHEFALGSDQLVLAAPDGDELAKRRTVRLSGAELADRDFVEYRADSALRAQIDAACERAGLHRRIVCEVDTMSYLVELIDQGVGVSFLPPMALRSHSDRITAVPTDPPMRRNLAAVVASDRAVPPAARALLQLLPTESPMDSL